MTAKATTLAQVDTIGELKHLVGKSAWSVLVRGLGDGSQVLANLGLTGALSSPGR